MRSPSHELLGDTDPREHGPGWRYVAVPLSARGTKLRSLVGPETRIARAVPPDAFVVNPDRVGVEEPWSADRDRHMSHKPMLIDEDHPPRHGGLIIAMPPERIHLSWTQDGPITGDQMLAEEHRHGSAVPLNTTFGPGVEIVGVVVPQRTDAPGPVSAWDAEWLTEFAAARELPVIETPVADHGGQQVRLGADGWQVESPEQQSAEGDVYPLSADGDFRSTGTEYDLGLLMDPQQVGKALEDLSTAGVADGELRAIAAGYERAVDRNEIPRVSLGDAGEAVQLSVRDDTVSDYRYGRYEQETVVTAGGAFTRRVHDERFGEIVEATHPELTARVVENAKEHHPELATQLDALYDQARTPNAIRWAHEQRMGGRISDGVRQQADRWAGRPIDWQVVQHQAERATAQDWARVAESVAASGTPLTLVTNEGVRHYQPAKSQPERGGSSR